MPLLVMSLTGERAFYLALELDRSWTEMIFVRLLSPSAQKILSGSGAKLRMAEPLFAGTVARVIQSRLPTAS